MSKSSPISIPCCADPLVSILICVSSGIDLLLECLSSIESHSSSGVSFEVIVVLNEPYTEEEHRLRQNVEGVEIVFSPINLGLAGAANRARAQASGKFLIVLHDDTVVCPGWMDNLVEASYKHTKAGVIGSLILNTDGSLQSSGSILWSNSDTSACVNEANLFPDATQIRYVDYCGTSSMLVPAALWDQVGGMDEQFFPAYYVDVDFCMAVRAAGFAVILEPSSRVLHHRSASTEITLRSFTLLRNKVSFSNKWSGALEQQELQDPSDEIGAMLKALHRASSKTYLGNNAKLISSPQKFDAIAQQKSNIDIGRKFREDYINYLSRRTRDPDLQYYSISPYVFGETIRFDFEGVGHSYTVFGEWHNIESWGIWAKSNQVRLWIPIGEGFCDQLKQQHILRAHLSLTHLLTPERPVSEVEVIVNGGKSILLYETRPGIHTYCIELKAEELIGECAIGMIIKSFSFAHPQEFGVVSDDRKLSFGLVDLQFSIIDPE